MNIDLTLKLQDAIIERPELTEKYQKLFELGHFGTHIDTHSKTSIPLDYFSSRGVLFDVSHAQDRDVELQDFDYHKIKAHDFVIFKTGMLRTYGYGTHDYFKDHAQLADSTIEYLISCKIRFIGIDAAGVRRGAEHIVADKKCEAHGIYIVENLANLEQIPQAKANEAKQPNQFNGLNKGDLGDKVEVVEAVGHGSMVDTGSEFKVFALWLESHHKTGLPCRIVVEV